MIKAHIAGTDRIGILGICFGQREEGCRWVETIQFLSSELQIAFSDYGVEMFDRATRVAWFVYRDRPA